MAACSDCIFLKTLNNGWKKKITLFIAKKWKKKQFTKRMKNNAKDGKITNFY